MKQYTKNQLKLAIGLAAITGVIVLALGVAPIAAIAIPLSVFTFVFLSLRTIAHFTQKKIAKNRVTLTPVDLSSIAGSARTEPEMTEELHDTAHAAIEANLKSCAKGAKTSDITTIIMDYYHDASWDAWPSKKLAQEQFKNKQTVKTQQEAYLEEQRKKAAEVQSPAQTVIVPEPLIEIPAVLGEEPEVSSKMYSTAYMSLQGSLQNPILTKLVAEYWFDSGDNPCAEKAVVQEEFEKRQITKVEQAQYLEAQRTKGQTP